jgi:hypothetical protein
MFTYLPLRLSLTQIIVENLVAITDELLVCVFLVSSPLCEPPWIFQRDSTLTPIEPNHCSPTIHPTNGNRRYHTFSKPLTVTNFSNPPSCYRIVLCNIMIINYFFTRANHGHILMLLRTDKRYQWRKLEGP